MSAADLNTDKLLSDLGGCGRFQIGLTAYLQLAFLALSWTTHTNQYGIYNPGWRCLDNVTLFTNTSQSEVEDLAVYEKHSCSDYRRCQNVEFDPSTSTLLTEWQMVCNRKWMMSTMLMITNVGALASNIFVGYFGDRYGRKFPGLFARIMSAAILNFVSVFSTSWAMYTTIHFFIGLLQPFEQLWKVLLFELVPSTWRIRVNSLGINVVYACIHTGMAMYLKSWRDLLLIASIIAVLTQVPGFWLPESMRWLIATGRKEEANKVVERIARTNKKEKPKVDYVEILTIQNEERSRFSKNKRYTFLDLFRKGYRLRTIVIGIIRFGIVMVYYTLHFTIITLPGNVYLNMTISHLAEVPSNLIAFLLANRCSRKRIYTTMLVLVTCCMTTLIIVNRFVQGPAYLALNLTFVLLAKCVNHIKWSVMSIAVVEMYPTVVRSNIQSFYYLMSSLGSIVAPFMIPTDRDTLFTSFVVMAVVSAICAASSFSLPETKDIPLLDTFPGDNVTTSDKVKEKRENVPV